MVKSNMKFSIIMPAYNAEKYIKEAIDSVLSQIYQNWELIIVDDGSVDNTGAIIDDYSQKDKRIISVHQQNSGTAAAARNTALKYVTGDYVQILDSDDLLSEDCLAKYVEAYHLSNKKDAISIFSPVCISIDSSKKELGEIASVSKYINKEFSGTEAFDLSLDWNIHGFCAFRRDLILNVRFDEKLINGDEFTTRKLFFNANKIIFTTGRYLFRKNENSTTRSEKNRVRMYECLETDKNIYNYSINNDMPKEIRKKCLKKYCKSLIAHEAQFLREKNDYTFEEQNNLKLFLSNNYAFIKQVKSIKAGLWNFWYFFSFGSFTIFVKLCTIYNFIWKVIK